MHRWSDFGYRPWVTDERRTAERQAEDEPHPLGCMCRECAWDELAPEEKSGADE